MPIEILSEDEQRREIEIITEEIKAELDRKFREEREEAAREMKRDFNEDLRICSEATPGPWKAVKEIDGAYSGRQTVVKTFNPSLKWSPRIVSVGQTRMHVDEDAECNIRFIAEAREGWPAALTEIGRLETEVARLVKEYDNAYILGYANGKAAAFYDKLTEESK